WVKGHAGHDLNEAADERANAAAKAYQQKKEPRRGPGFQLGSAAETPVPEPTPSSEPVEGSGAPAGAPLWAEAPSLFDVFDEPATTPVELQVTLTADEHARLRDRADAQGISLTEALRRLI